MSDVRSVIAAHAHHCFLIVANHICVLVFEHEAGFPVLRYVEPELVKPILEVIAELLQCPAQEVTQIPEYAHVDCKVTVHGLDFFGEFEVPASPNIRGYDCCELRGDHVALWKAIVGDASPHI